MKKNRKSKTIMINKTLHGMHVERYVKIIPTELSCFRSTTVGSIIFTGFPCHYTTISRWSPVGVITVARQLLCCSFSYF